jgi:hypothetical protein
MPARSTWAPPACRFHHRTGLGGLRVGTGHAGLGDLEIETDHTGLEGHGVAMGHVRLGHNRFERRPLVEAFMLTALSEDWVSAWTYSSFCQPNCYAHGRYGY